MQVYRTGNMTTGMRLLPMDLLKADIIDHVPAEQQEAITSQWEVGAPPRRYCRLISALCGNAVCCDMGSCHADWQADNDQDFWLSLMQAIEIAMTKKGSQDRKELAELFECLIFITLQRRIGSRTQIEDHSAVRISRGPVLCLEKAFARQIMVESAYVCTQNQYLREMLRTSRSRLNWIGSVCG